MEKFKIIQIKKYFHNAHPIACYLLPSEARLKWWQLFGFYALDDVKAGDNILSHWKKL